MHHTLTYDLGRPQGSRAYHPGRDSGNCIVRCSCGWACSNTYEAVQERGAIHLKQFRGENRAWNDPDRVTRMPSPQF